MNYLELLEHSYKEMLKYYDDLTRWEYLSYHIFSRDCCDAEMEILISKMLLEVCVSITDGTTFEYISDSNKNYKNYMFAVNMTFLEDRVEYGTSIRGAWWGNFGDEKIKYNTCGLYIGEDQVCEWEFTTEEWGSFIKAIEEFSKG